MWVLSGKEGKLQKRGLDLGSGGFWLSQSLGLHEPQVPGLSDVDVHLPQKWGWRAAVAVLPTWVARLLSSGLPLLSCKLRPAGASAHPQWARAVPRVA